MSDVVDGLVSVLFNRSAREDERHDVAMDLGEYFQDDRALLALAKAASDPKDEDVILGACGESIGEILVEQGKFRKEFIEPLVPIAKMEAVGFINARKPEWIKQYNLEEFLE